MGKREEQTGKKVFISYLDDGGIQRSTYVYLLEQTESFVKFQTHSNIITIPINRVLKIKESIGEES